MRARRKPLHIYSVFAHSLSSSVMLYFGSSEPAALRTFARSIVRYPEASSIELRRDSATWVRVAIAQVRV